MEVTVAGETISRKEFEESAGWRTVGSRKLLIERPPVTGAEAQRGNNSKEQCERRLRQIERSSRMPQLPRGDYKIIIRPKGGLRVAEHGAARLATSIYHAAEIPREAQDEDTICPNFQQNIIVVSTPIEAHADKYQKIAIIKIGNQTFETNAYEAAPDCTPKGVIRGIPLEDTRDITANDELFVKVGIRELPSLDGEYFAPFKAQPQALAGTRLRVKSVKCVAARHPRRGLTDRDASTRGYLAVSDIIASRTARVDAPATRQPIRGRGTSHSLV
ncbi:hypothetical protein HPB50_021599 [Hyalomma asiaticum]|uniref:Uncharacterized protein n=1 Tax=Hyalomma asiaticum TaxID=266040 RepID=A0ACB7TLH3_HYAAI|nr:hypothetical protein HPB50_021599 [Hyalomma asiaticum]